MCKNEDNSLGFAIGVLAGVIGGIAAGVLLAPKSGKESRRELHEAIVKVGEKISPEIIEAKRKASDMIESTKCKLEKKYIEIAADYKANKLAKAKNKEQDIYSL